MVQSLKQVFLKSILAGIAISLGCIVYLNVGGVAGAALFSFGLLTCVNFKLPLFTGTAGFVISREDYVNLAVILLGNIVGCFAMAVAMDHAHPNFTESLERIVNARTGFTVVESTILGICCGMIMTVAVKFAREKSYLPLLFGVPLFILCGFLHSIADAFYISMGTLLSYTSADTYVNYLFVVIGNFVGCNAFRWIAFKPDYSEAA